MAPTEFWDYIRGLSDHVPAGYTEKGMNFYRYLVYLGVDQMLEICFEEIRKALSDEDWEALLKDFIAKSKWESHFYGDLENAFMEYLASETVSSSDVSNRVVA
jgi:hypothetical protein